MHVAPQQQYLCCGSVNMILSEAVVACLQDRGSPGMNGFALGRHMHVNVELLAWCRHMNPCVGQPGQAA